MEDGMQGRKFTNEQLSKMLYNALKGEFN